MQSPSRGSELAATSTSSADDVLLTAYRLLVTEGPAALTPTRLHTQTGVARTTIYRHWPTNTALLRDILERATAQNARTLRSGNLQQDLTVATGDVLARLQTAPFSAMVAALMAADPHGEDALVTDYIIGFAQPVADVLRSAMEHGELPRRALERHIVDLLGPAITRTTLIRCDDHGEDPADVVGAFLNAQRIDA